MSARKATSAKKKVEPTPEDVAKQKLVKKWLKSAPELKGLRRPGLRLKAAALVQRMDSSGLKAGTDDIDGMATFVADVDELLATIGGQEYIDWIVEVPLDDAVQMAVLMELFTSKIMPSLGKG